MPNIPDQLPSCNGHYSHHMTKHVTSRITSSSTANQNMEEFMISIRKDAEAATALAERLKPDLVKGFVDIIEKCNGCLITSGIGKSGIVAERMSRSLSSTGTPAHYVHGAEWTHGDLGKARRGDVCVFFSHSGNTRECIFAASHLRLRGVHILSVIGHDDCKLAESSDAFISYELENDLEEPIGGVPTTSVVLQEMIINAVVCELITRKRFSKIEFARNHPGEIDFHRIRERIESFARVSC
eukprot:TCONS_00071795-protein